jgi:hypothetical protein
MYAVPMSLFLDFALASGRPKVTAVTAWKTGHADNDFYLQLKTALRRMHQAGAGVASLSSFVEQLNDPRRKRIYPRLIASYGKWLTKMAPVTMLRAVPRPLAWFGSSALSVIVNPEVAFLSPTTGTTVFVKLYLRSEPLTKQRVDLTLELMRHAYQDPRAGVGPRERAPTPAVLDVRARKLHVHDGLGSNALGLLLHGEMASFMTIDRRM